MNNGLTLGKKIYQVSSSFDPILEKVRHYITEWEIVNIILNDKFTTTVKLRKQNKYVNHDIVYRTETWEANNSFFQDCFDSEKSANNHIEYMEEHPTSYCFGYHNKVNCPHNNT